MFEWTKWHDKLPDEKLEVYQPNLRLFFETMWERQMIWKRRFVDKSPRPWTDNKIFQESKFTNVYRDLDRNSQWEIKNIFLDESLSLKNLVWKIMVFRTFNNPETFTFDPAEKNIQMSLFDKPTELISAKKWKNGIPDWEEYDAEEFTRFIAGLRSVGQNPFTSAYLINSMAAPGKSRDYCYTQVVIPYMHDHIDELIDVVKHAKKPEEIITYLKTFPSVADFIAHEYYQDFTYIPKYTKRQFMPFDQNDFTNVGPGASVGIRLIFPNLKTKKDQMQAIYKLRDLSKEWLLTISEERNASFPYLYWNKALKKYYTSWKHNLTLHQIEMWLCEFQKYWKMMIGEGKQRSKFEPKTKSL